MKLSKSTDFRPAFKDGIHQIVESEISPTIPQMADIPPYANSIQSGTFGTTFLSRDRQYAIKIIDYNKYRVRNEDELKYLLSIVKIDLHNEIINYHDISQKCPEYFCRFVGYNYDHTDFKMHIIMEYCGKDLHSVYQHAWNTVNQKVDQASAITYGYESRQQKLMRLQQMFHGILYKAFAPILHKIALAIRCLHSNNYVHFDIKPENIVVAGNTVKFIDAGSLVKITNTGLTKVYGTMGYVAPELINPETKNMVSTIDNTSALMKTDIFSFGMMIQKMKVNMFHNDYMQRILSINPDDRPSIDEIIEVIESPAPVPVPAPAPVPAPTVNPDMPIEDFLGGLKRSGLKRSGLKRSGLKRNISTHRKSKRTIRHRQQKRSKRRQGTPFV